MNLEEVLNFRRSVRRYDKNKPIDSEKVKHCLGLATLAPNSSNMQLWEFYQITNPGLMAKVSEACLGQSAASTASEIVVLLLVRICIKSVLNLCLTLKKEISGAIVRKSVRKNVLGTGSCIMVNWMPFIYARFSGF